MSERQGHLEIVLDQQDRYPCLVDLRQNVAHFLEHDRRQTFGRFIH